MKIQTSAFCCTRNGLTIRGYEYRPEGGRLPIAIVSHGFMANQRSVRQYVRRLAQWGYAAYCFDFCGGCIVGKSDGRTTDMTVFTEQADLEAVVHYAKALPYTDASHIILMGCSQGGFVSALAAAKLRKEIRKLVLFYPALCIPDDARSGKMMFAKFKPSNIPEVIQCGLMRLGREYAASVLGVDPYAAIAPYPGPVLIVHGTRDNIVDPKYAEQAAAAYEQSAANRCELVLLENAGHGFSRKDDARAIPIIQRFLLDS